jgi:hypothetical protein
MKGKLSRLLSFLLLSVLSAAADIRITAPGEPVVVGGRGIKFSGYGQFSPLDLPGLAAWYDASDSATVLTSVGPDVPATNGQPVRRWMDKSGNGRHLDQTVLANQPTFADGIVSFDGSTSKFSLASSLPAGNGAYFGVYKATTNNSFLFSVIGSIEGIRLARRTNGQHLMVGGSLVAGGVHGSNTVLRSDVLNGASSYIRANAISVATGNAGTAIAPTSVGFYSQLSVYFSGTVSEVIILSEVPPLSTVQKVEKYLARKWGISL